MNTGWKVLAGAYALAIIGAGALAVAGPPSAGQIRPAPETLDTSKWSKTFDDEFDGAALDQHKWTQGEAGDTVGQRTMMSNAEREVYVDPAWLGAPLQPVTLSGGKATLTAQPLPDPLRTLIVARADANPSDRAPGFSKLAYSSGRITTRGRFAQLYGYFEIRARMPAGRGLWPAFWLLPSDGSWPPEIDVVEILGHDPNTVYMTLHTSVRQTNSDIAHLEPSPDGFHRYGALWTPATVDFFIDGVKVASAPTPADMHKPMYLVANLAVGGAWPGDPDASTAFPARMDIDYVRAWKLPKQPAGS